MNTFILYVDPGFLSFICKEERKAINDPSVKIEEILFIKKLLSRGRIYFNLEDKPLFELISAEAYRMNPFYDEDFFHYAKCLIALNSNFYSCKNEIYQIEKNPTQYDYGKSNTPLYYLTDKDDASIKYFNETTGFILINKSLNINRYENGTQQPKFVKAFDTMKIEKYTNILPVPYSLIIEDPYIYTVDIKFFKDLLYNLVKEKTSCFTPYKIYIITKCPTNQKNATARNVKMFEKFNKEIEEINKIGVYSIQVDSKNEETANMHDRHIFTEKFWITCTHSLRNYYNTNIEWIYKPVALFFPQYLSRIRYATKKMKKASNQPLVLRYIK